MIHSLKLHKRKSYSLQILILSCHNKIRKKILRWENLNFHDFFSSQDSKCGGCDTDKAAQMVQLFGQPYHANTLKPTVPSEQACMSRVSI